MKDVKTGFIFRCPSCSEVLQYESEESWFCTEEQLRFERIDGIWRFLLPQRASRFDQFIGEYETVRQAEGRGSPEPGYYRMLPQTSPTDPRAGEWCQRAKSFQLLLDMVVGPSEKGATLRIADLGAGNCWLSHQLAKRGHQVAAVDLRVSPGDGLGAHRHYDISFTPVQAEFDKLPFPDGHFDLVLFNAALHYSEDYDRTIAEALRIVSAGGSAVVVDTPIYYRWQSGLQMVLERRQAFSRLVGFPSDALASEDFLTYDRLASLSESIEGHLEIVWPIPWWRRTVRRWRARVNRRREPAQFPLLIWRKSIMEEHE